MPEKVCRISWRKGSRLSLVISPRIGFLDLPREARDNIYEYSLSTGEPIVVWSGRHDIEGEDSRSSGAMTITRCQTVHSKSPVLDSLALGLLVSNRQVSQVAATLFYSANAFRFAGDRNWSPLYSFLQMIGDRNRTSLRHLDVRVPQPQRLWQHADGTRTTLISWPFREVMPGRSRFLPPCLPPFVEGLVDHVDPAIEACFRILGKRIYPLFLILQLDCRFLPGVTLFEDPYSGSDWSFSLDIPNVVEACCREITTELDLRSNIDIRWKGECSRQQFRDHAGIIDEAGWVTSETIEKHVPDHRYPRIDIQFILYRKDGPFQTQ